MTLQTNSPLEALANVRPLRSLVDAQHLDSMARNNLFGQPPVNPFERLRTERSTSVVGLAATTHIDRKALARVEKGMYAQPLPSLVDYWVNLGVITHGEIWSDYENYQYVQRRRFPLFFGPSLTTTPNGIHPFRRLRANRPALHDPEVTLPVGITECCELLCLPLDTIQFFEKKWRTQQSVPKLLKSVLSQIGYTRQQITTFETGYKTWRNENKTLIRDAVR